MSALIAIEEVRDWFANQVEAGDTELVVHKEKLDRVLSTLDTALVAPVKATEDGYEPVDDTRWGIVGWWEEERRLVLGVPNGPGDL